MKRLNVPSGSVVLLVFLALVVMVFYGADHRFLSFSNLNNILLQASAAAVAAVGMTYVILLGDIDLSIGSTMSLATVVGVTLTSSGTQFSIESSVWVIPAALIVGLACGLLNALLINRLRLNALIVTLGTTSIYAGIALTITQAGTMLIGGVLPAVVGANLGGISGVVLVAIVLAAVAAGFLRLRPNGRLIYAVGGDVRSATESGLSRAKARYIAFGFLGVTGAIAGLITVGQVGSVEANLGADFAFTVITAVVIGGTSLFGGRGSVTGSVLGAVLLATIDSGLNSVNASIYVYDVVRGAILVLAMLSDSFTSRLSAKRAMAAVHIA